VKVQIIAWLYRRHYEETSAVQAEWIQHAERKFHTWLTTFWTHATTWLDTQTPKTAISVKLILPWLSIIFWKYLQCGLGNFFEPPTRIKIPWIVGKILSE
jgi:hypothetical protein